jgi:3-phenylpropionate/trans-cinnamate dioxygenase ferredoxin reductase subunit
MSTSAGLVIVGSGPAGYTLANQLAALGFSGPITLVGDEAHPPYDRPPLSKEFQLGDETTLALQPSLAPGVRLLTGSRAVAIHTQERMLELADGSRLAWSRLVLATGTRARPFPGSSLSGNVMSLRTLDDAREIRARLRQSSRIAVIGGGPIGLELAACAHQLGITTTVIEAAERLMARSAPKAIAERLLVHHRSHGVQVELNAQVTRIDEGMVYLQGGRAVPADLVVVGIGVLANDDLARQAGIACDDGIIIDGFFRTNLPDVFAIGDVTRQRNPISGRFERIETWFNAQGQAIALAQRLAGAGAGATVPYSEVPWYWSDQGKLRLQCAGLVEGQIQASRGEVTSGFLHGLWSDGRLVGLAAINAPQDFNLLRRQIGREDSITPAQFIAGEFRSLQLCSPPAGAPDSPASVQPEQGGAEQSLAGQSAGIAACPLTDIDEGGIGSTTLSDGTRVAIYRVRGEEVFATDDRCSHGASSLCDEGALEGYVIECGLHLGSFDIRTGKPVATPCTKSIRTYPAHVRGGTIWIATQAASTQT